MVDTFVNATSAALGLAIRYTQETVGGSSVFTDMGKITDMSSPGTVWAITSTPSGGVGLVSMVSGQATITGGIQISGTVNVSGPVAVQSGGVIPISVVSSPGQITGIQVSGAVGISGQVQNLVFDLSAAVWRNTVTLTSSVANPVLRVGGLSGDFPLSIVSIVSATPTFTVTGGIQVSGTVAVSGGFQVSGTVNVSGPVAIQSGGTIPVSIVSSPLALGVQVSGTVAISGAVMVSTIIANWSGLVVIDNMQVNNSANVDTFVGLGSASMPIPVRIFGNYRNVSTGVISITCSAGAGVNMSGDYLLLSAGNTSTKFRLNYIQFFNAGTLSSQQTGLAWTSATGGSYFRTFLQPQQGWNANLVGANFVGSAGAALYATLATVSGTPVDVTVIYEIVPGSWVEGANV